MKLLFKTNNRTKIYHRDHQNEKENFVKATFQIIVHIGAEYGIYTPTVQRSHPKFQTPRLQKNCVARENNV